MARAAADAVCTLGCPFLMTLSIAFQILDAVCRAPNVRPLRDA